MDGISDFFYKSNNIYWIATDLKLSKLANHKMVYLLLFKHTKTFIFYRGGQEGEGVHFKYASFPL